ncbi:MAG: 1,2-phenylacetyl-CoA epoxidase subunit PaaC [Sediminibacterium sp.]
MNNSLINFTLHHADNALIIGHRNSEWCGHGPVLEQDIAVTNIALDFIGQARNFYQYAASLTGNDATEDSLAYLRDVPEFKNVLIAELPNGDWAQTTLRTFFFSAYQYYYYQQLQKSSDTTLAAIAEKSLKEVTYHLRWSSEWVIRLGDGTAESKERLLNALQELWPYTGELFLPASFETDMLQQNIGVDLVLVKENWEKKVAEIFAEATIEAPEKSWAQQGGKTGIHTEYLGYILAEMQFLQRAYPGATW